mmetsp:Transcript_33334/g.58473  ORF Transcript_33334/g.58473 Transcript_33334/m.58473 type:complete len:451 (+) Transcript_33334:28-1380(+)
MSGQEEEKVVELLPPLRRSLSQSEIEVSFRHNEALEESKEEALQVAEEQQAPQPELMQFSEDEIVEEIEAADSDSSFKLLDSTLHASSIRDDRWVCPICLDLFQDPVEAPCCHNLFCERCVFNISKCPLCNARLFRCIPNIPIRRLVEELCVRCRHQGCNKTVQNMRLREHETVCDYALLPCIYSASCGLIARKDLGKHLEVDCKYRPVLCFLDCGSKFAMIQLEHHIQHECPNTMAQCPQNCSLILRRAEIQEHIKNDCPHSVIACSLENDMGVRCGYECMRIELTEHQLMCDLRKVKCNNQDCPAKVIYRNFSAHAETCRYKIIDCDNGCGLRVTRGDLIRHKAEVCSKQEIICPYARLGCDAVFLRQQQKAHLEAEAQAHSIQTVNGIERQHKEIVTMQAEISTLQTSVRDANKKYFHMFNLIQRLVRMGVIPEEALHGYEEGQDLS